MSVAAGLNAKLTHVHEQLERAFSDAPGVEDACLTCSFQAEDVLLLKLALELRPALPTLFLDTGYHFAETYAYRDQIAQEWNVRLINLLPLTTVAEQEAQHGLLYQTSPDRCCAARKVEPLFRAVANYKVWITGLRREQAKTRAGLEESALFTLPGGKQVLKLSPLAHFTTADVWHACEELGIPLLPLYARGYSSIGCEPCTSLPFDPNDARSGRWAGRKVECGIHIEAAK
ncbi:MAG TPA: phosphoadenylyl-sulfate reductase [Acidobacteriaceae bacterium]